MKKGSITKCIYLHMNANEKTYNLNQYESFCYRKKEIFEKIAINWEMNSGY